MLGKFSLLREGEQAQGHLCVPWSAEMQKCLIITGFTVTLKTSTTRGLAVLGYFRNALADTAGELLKTSPAPDHQKTKM
jgi:hypothetical protein